MALLLCIASTGTTHESAHVVSELIGYKPDVVFLAGDHVRGKGHAVPIDPSLLCAGQSSQNPLALLRGLRCDAGDCRHACSVTRTTTKTIRDTGTVRRVGGSCVLLAIRGLYSSATSS